MSTCVLEEKLGPKKKDSLINYVQDTRVRRKSFKKYAKRRFVMWSKGVRTILALRYKKGPVNFNSIGGGRKKVSRGKSLIGAHISN